MDIKDICNAGGDILDTVADAINRNDYSGLSRNISKTVDHVIGQVREDAKKGTYGDPIHRYGKTTYTRQGQAGYRSIYRSEKGKYANIYRKNDTGGTVRPRDRNNGGSGRKEPSLPAVVTTRPAGSIAGPLQLAWGILATSGFGITALVMTIMLAVSGGTVFTVLAAVFGVLTVWGITDIIRGNRKIGLVRRFRRYSGLIGDRSYIPIEELASQTAQKKDDVLRDLKKMMKKHMFPQGCLDSGQTTFILTQEAYRQYLQTEQDRRQREEVYRQEQAREAKNAADHARDQEVERILTEGNAYIRMVHGCIEKIRNEQMSDKLTRLERIMRRIFEHVERHPDSAGDLHKFMNYYLPTTTKLLNAYIDMDRQEVYGENITATKREIEDTLDIINEAFENLLDSLFEDTAWDISSDISVMKTMMAQEGLTGEKDFKSNRDSF